MPFPYHSRPRRTGFRPAVAAMMLLLSVTTPAFADLEEAKRALEAKDYDTALREAQPLADQGDEVAQRIAQLAKLMIDLKRLRDEHLAATGPIDLRDYDGRTKTRSAQDQARFESGRRHYHAEAYEAAFRDWAPLAEAGDAEAAYMLSILYGAGNGVAKDSGKADSYRLQAAEGGFGRAQGLMPQVFDVMSGDEVVPGEGFRWAMRAAANGEIGGYYALNAAYCDGRGVDRNPVLADIWLYMAMPDKDLFLDRICSQDVEWPTSYYEAIAKRAKAMQQAYDIPIAASDVLDDTKDGDAADGSP